MAKATSLLANGKIYDSVRERVYETQKSALFGIITWKEIVDVDRLGSTLVFEGNATKDPDKVFINGMEYTVLIPYKQVI